ERLAVEQDVAVDDLDRAQAGLYEVAGDRVLADPRGHADGVEARMADRPQARVRDADRAHERREALRADGRRAEREAAFAEGGRQPDALRGVRVVADGDAEADGGRARRARDVGLDLDG